MQCNRYGPQGRLAHVRSGAKISMQTEGKYPKYKRDKFLNRHTHVRFDSSKDRTVQPSSIMCPRCPSALRFLLAHLMPEFLLKLSGLNVNINDLGATTTSVYQADGIRRAYGFPLAAHHEGELLLKVDEHSWQLMKPKNMHRRWHSRPERQND